MNANAFATARRLHDGFCSTSAGFALDVLAAAGCENDVPTIISLLRMDELLVIKEFLRGFPSDGEVYPPRPVPRAAIREARRLLDVQPPTLGDDEADPVQDTPTNLHERAREIADEIARRMTGK